MRGVITCMNCGFHQSWISQSNGIGVSKCRKCDRMNRFNPRSTRWGLGKGEQRGRTAAVWFRERPESMPRHALNEEAISRNYARRDDRLQSRQSFRTEAGLHKVPLDPSFRRASE